MLARLLIVVCVIGVALISPLGVIAQEPTGVEFTLVQDIPVVEHSAGSLPSRFIDPGVVLYHDGQFHMFANEIVSWPARPSYVTYRTSPDGINWTEVSNEPVFTSEGLDYARFGILVSSGFVEPDGTWVLYFYTLRTGNWPVTGGSIGLVTAPDATGPWTLTETPILEPGARREWDGYQVGHPFVIAVDDGYVMYYMGADRLLNMRFGRATSADGLEWVKYDDPSTTDELLVVSDPVWEMPAKQMFAPKVMREGERFYMIYGEPSFGYYLISSDDGVSWDHHPANTVWAVTESELSPPASPVIPALVYHDGTYYLYMEIDMGGVTDLYLATYEGELATGQPE